MSILKKTEDVAPSTQATSAPHTILNTDASFEGKLSFQGAVRIDGRFIGEITTDDVLVVGKGDVQGVVSVGTLILHGQMRGTVKAKRSIELHGTARLTGDIETPQLVVHPNATFDGQCKMSASRGGADDANRNKRPEILRVEK